MTTNSDRPTFPALQSALLCLDLNLDQELDRYRHWRKTGKTYSYIELSKTEVTPTQNAVQNLAQNPYSAFDRADKSEQADNTELISLQSSYQSAAVHNLGVQILGSNVSPSLVQNSELIAPKPAIQNLENQNISVDNPTANQAQLAQLFNPSPENLSSQESNQHLSQVPDQTRELLQNLTNPPASTKSDRFKFTSPLGIFLLVVLCSISGLLGYLLIDRIISNKPLPSLTPAPQPNSTPTPQSNSDILQPNSSVSSDLNDFSKTSIPQLVQPAQTGTPTIPSFSSQVGSISTLLKPPVRFNQPAVSVRRFPPAAAQTWQEAPAPQQPEYSAPSPVVRSQNYAPVSPTKSSFSGLDAVKNLGNPPPIMSTNPLREAAPSSVPKLLPATNSVNLDREAQRNSNPVVTAPQPPNKPLNLQPVNPIDNAPVRYAPLVTAKSELAPETNAEKRYAVTAPNRYITEGKQVEKEAFIRSSDGQVQLGSFKDAESAQRRIEELRKQGIPVDAIRVEAK